MQLQQQTPSILTRPYASIRRVGPISNFGVFGSTVFYVFIQILIEHTESNQRRP